jgi:hypothetical protein
VASEDSSGRAIRRARSPRPAMRICGAIIVEAAWAYRHRPAVGATLRKRSDARRGGERDRVEGAASIARAVPQSDGTGKSQAERVTAVGRELLGSSGRSGSRSKPAADARRTPSETETQRMRIGGVERHTEWRILDRHYAAGLRARPALLVRGSSRRITIMRCRPANIRVINRRDQLSRLSPRRHSRAHERLSG